MNNREETKAILSLDNIVIGYLDNDDQEFESMIKQLSQHKIMVITTTIVETAMDWINNAQIHALISDWKMPYSGDRLLQDLREREKEIPFILYSGHGAISQLDLKLAENYIIRVHKLDLATLPFILKAEISDFKNKNPTKYDLIYDNYKKSNTIDNIEVADQPISKEEFDETLFDKYSKYVIKDLERILTRDGDKVRIKFNENLDLNIKEIIEELNKMDETGQLIFDFWMTGFLDLMTLENE